MQVQEELQEALDATNSALQDIADQINTAAAAAHPPRFNTKTTNNNDRIHPQSLYSTSEPDFASLAQEFPCLQPYLLPLKTKQQQQPPLPLPSTSLDTTSATLHQRRRRTIDFTNPSACRELTKILLKKDFGVEWDLPDGHLVPPVTNRLNYILWVQDLLQLSSPTGFTEERTLNKHISRNSSTITTVIRGLDIGCGASCIYPLLGASLLNWHFIGVDVTNEALEWAQKNLDMNLHLKEMIKLRKVEMQPEQKMFYSSSSKNDDAEEKKEEKEELLSSSKGILASCFEEKEDNNTESFAFTMCNPPFFEKFDHASSNPSTAFGGTEVESVYPGGEEAFVRSIFEDSLVVKDRVHWFTTMVGKKVTLKALRKWLHAEPSVAVVRTTEFFQGQTSRWGVAWSFVADPSVALKPIERSHGVLNKRTASGVGEEEEKLIKKRKIIGRSVSLDLALKDSNAALNLLNHVQTRLEGSFRELTCSLDASQYQLTAEPPPLAADDGGVDGDNGDNKNKKKTGSSKFTVQLLAQQANRYVMTIALSKKANTSSATSTMDWFSQVVAEIEAASFPRTRMGG
jgi:23S rRNA (adenine1618-N6)-methyltransferase